MPENEACRMCQADQTGDRMVMRGDDIPLCQGHWNRWVARYLFPSTEEPPCSAHVIQGHTNGTDVIDAERVTGSSGWEFESLRAHDCVETVDVLFWDIVGCQGFPDTLFPFPCEVAR